MRKLNAVFFNFILITMVASVFLPRGEAQLYIPFSFWGKKTVWTPTDLGTNLIGWYDAADPVTIRTGAAGISQAVDGDPVSEWMDKSGYANHADQTMSARQPIYNATGWTGLSPTIVWNATDSSLVVSQTWQAYSYAMVVRHNSVSGVRALLTKRSAVSANFFWFIYDATSGTINWDQNGGRYNTGFTPVAATDYLYTVVRPLNGTNRSQYVNGTLSGTTSTNGNDSNSNTLFIGNDYSAANRGAASIISELIIVSNDLSTNDRESLEGYLAWKWSLVSSLPVTHPYKLRAP